MFIETVRQLGYYCCIAEYYCGSLYQGRSPPRLVSRSLAASERGSLPDSKKGAGPEVDGISNSADWRLQRPAEHFISGDNVTSIESSAWLGRLGPAAWRDGDGPTVLDLCAGCGGFTLGFKSAGYRVVLAADLDPLAVATYKRNFPYVPVLRPSDRPLARRPRNGALPAQKSKRPSESASETSDVPLGDLTQMTGEQLLDAAGIGVGEVDVVVAGLPCQGYSYIGQRRSDDPRNSLYRHFVRLIGELQPRVFLFENVPGMATFGGGQVFNDCIDTLKDLGYSVESRILDAAAFGIPQQRTRLFVFGVRPGSATEIANFDLGTAKPVTVSEAIEDLPVDLGAVPFSGPFELQYECAPVSQFARLMRGSSLVVRNCAPTLHGDELLSRLTRLAAGATDQKTGHRRLNGNAPAWTIRAGNHTRTACRPIHPTADRVISIREAARLCAFPDEFLLPDTRAVAHMLLGNSVPPVLSYHLASAIAQYVFGRPGPG